MQKPGFKRIEHLSDTGIEFHGDSPERLFENAAKGMFSIITDTRNISKKKVLNISILVDHNSLEDLLILWLEKLIYHFETSEMVFSNFEIRKISRSKKGYRLDAKIMGENIIRNKHDIRIGIKAPTYHQLTVKDTGQKWRGRVIFDI